ncbi:thiolase C-terminal domain-containing protein [Cryptosporangium sp. NPDC051539]|uniref:thiolase C-terminal domain-containing protein n=1 Tax=Cryptosporangium sp. NPDC051539 TaxID=3363962 RepID=UPI0037AF145B
MSSPERVLRERTAIVGVGYTEYFRDSGVSTQTLALRAIVEALHDAGLAAHDLDGVACHRLADSADPAQIAQDLGLTDIRFVRDVFGGGSSSVGTLIDAAMAVATGQAETVVCWRALNSRSEGRMGAISGPAATAGDAQYWMPYRHLTPAQLFAMHTRAYLHRWGYGAEDLGRVAIAQRANALLSPRAMMTEPISMDDYLGSRWIAEPLRLLDCCLETDGAVALIVTTPQRARDLRQVPVLISGAAFGGGSQLTSNGWDDLSLSPARHLAPRLYAGAGMGPDDVDVAELYDAFTPLVLMQLEAYGFCSPGEAAGFVAHGSIGSGGELPVNTHGGHLSEGYVHGLNHVAEATNQLRRTCGSRQVAGAEVALATSQPGVVSGLTAAVLLRRDA